MQVKELIERLKNFDEERDMILEVICECGHLQVDATIKDIQYKGGNCVIEGEPL